MNKPENEKAEQRARRDLQDERASQSTEDAYYEDALPANQYESPGGYGLGGNRESEDGDDPQKGDAASDRNAEKKPGKK